MPFAQNNLALAKAETFGQDMSNRITVRVVDNSTGEAISEATVEMDWHGKDLRVPVAPKETDERGEATFRRTAKLFREGRHEVSVSHPQYTSEIVGEAAPGLTVVRLNRLGRLGPIEEGRKTGIPVSALVIGGLILIVLLSSIAGKKEE